MKEYESIHLVRPDDLNHHGTLFAARGAAWFVEAAFIAAGCTCGGTDGVVCRALEEMSFKRPVKPGTLLRFLARAVYAGSSSLTVAVTAQDALDGAVCLEGLVTFVTIGEDGAKRAHHIVLDEPEDEREAGQREAAKRLRSRQGR